RLYGDSFDDLWGELAPIPEANVHPVGNNTLGLDTFPSPGHASHHVCYLGADGTLYAGDAAGVRIQPDDFVAPPTPPPEFDLEAWDPTIDEVEGRAPARAPLLHFELAEEPSPPPEAPRPPLHSWTSRARQGATEEDFIREAADER